MVFAEDLLDQPPPPRSNRLVVAEPSSTRLAIPSDNIRAKAAPEIRSLFADDAAGARTPESRSAFARSLLVVSADEDDPARVFVLLDAATKFAVDAGDLPLALQAVDQQAATFAVDLQDKRLDILKEIAKSGSNATAMSVVEMLLSEADKLGNNGEFQAATSLISIAQATARRVKDHAGQQAAATRLGALRESQKRAAKIAPLIERLKNNPEDREAASLLGKHRCFVEGNWVAGLPLLAQGDDAELAKFAAINASGDLDLGERLKAADAWWILGGSSGGGMASAARQRARLQHAAIMECLAGLDKVRVQKRLEEPDPTMTTSDQRASPVFWLDATEPGTCVSAEGVGIKNQKSSALSTRIRAWAPTKGVRPATQFDVDHMPVFGTMALNGLPAVIFDGDDWLVSPVEVHQGGSIAIVVKTDKIDARGRWIGTVDKGSGIRLRLVPGGILTLSLVDRGDVTGSFSTPAGSIAMNGPQVVVAVWKADPQLWVNGRRLHVAVDGTPKAFPCTGS